MHRQLLTLLVDPQRHQQLFLAEGSWDHGEELDTGLLRAQDGAEYPILASIPRFVTTDDAAQLQTSDAFGYKWHKRDSYDSPQMKSILLPWTMQQYGFDTLEAWVTHFSAHERVMDLGCGAGLSSSLWLDTPLWTGQSMWVGVDISSAIDVARQRLAHIPNTHFVQADALSLPFQGGSFDLIFSEGVLHHTPSAHAALLSGAKLLRIGGEFHFYIYRRKSPVREFTDDYVRHAIAGLSDQEAWEAMGALTRLGQALSNLNIEVEVDDVPILGIKAGRIDVQRLIYWNFAKLYWNHALTFEENVHVNFDWYRPAYASRHTADEIRTWCAEADLTIRWFYEQESGFSVIAVKESQ